jgi:ligand-binding sensor domain-containing protein
MTLFAIFTLSFSIFTLNGKAQWQQTSFDSGDVTCFAIKGDTLFAGTDTNGIYLSINDGSNWSVVNTGLPSTYDVFALTIKGDTLLAGTGKNGVYLSINMGNNWTLSNSGMGNTRVNAFAISGNKIFAGTDSGMYLSSNNGGNWIAADSGLPANTQVFALAKYENDILAGTSSGVFVSSDNGQFWTELDTGLDSAIVSSFAINGNLIYAGTNKGVYYSNNLSSWNTENLYLNYSNGGVGALAVNAKDLFAGTYYGVYMTLSWSWGEWFPLNDYFNGWPSTNTYVNALALNNINLFVGTEGDGVWILPLNVITIGINEINNNANIVTVYPNPNNGKFQVSSSKSQIQSLEVYNVIGEEVYSSLLADNRSPITVNITDKPSGVYIVKAKSKEGIAFTKFVKE